MSEAQTPDDGLFRRWMEADMTDIVRTRMPFGKYGPEHYPPSGIPLYDLPLEYLEWFSRKGFPQGRLGELLRMLHQMKADGCDEVFDPFRKARGGRTSLREKRRG
jgi:uncharacterized protein (DUF3820 family)